MNDSAAKDFRLKIARYGVLEDSMVETTKQAILASAAPALLSTMDGLSDTEKATKLADAYFAAQGASGGEDRPEEKKVTTPQSNNMTAEDKQAIYDFFEESAETTGARAGKTRVVAQLTDKPILPMIHVEGAKLIPTVGEKTEQNLAKYASKLVDTPENLKAFNEIKAAVLKKEPMEVYLNFEAREKVIGWTVETIDNQGQPVTENLTKDAAISFLLIKVNGFVQNRDSNSIGIRIRWSEKRKQRAGNNEDAKDSKGVASVTVLNRKALQENKELTICTCTMLTSGGNKVVNNQYNAKTARYFEINTGKFDKDGKVQTRKIRMSGKTSAYRVVRKDEYLAAFGPAERERGVGITKADKQKISEARAQAVYAMLHDPDVADDSLRSALAVIRRTSTRTAGNFA